RERPLRGADGGQPDALAAAAHVERHGLEGAARGEPVALAARVRGSEEGELDLDGDDTRHAADNAEAARTIPSASPGRAGASGRGPPAGRSRSAAARADTRAPARSPRPVARRAPCRAPSARPRPR